ncbi:DUF3301 domain-containing protein [Endozoicomonas sp. Mp262]|uniref:DUF3301 domain-containing protein n=1 Tax=Endozoicomonas sp. Mp262 TaxID=2919499 RepID=UPI0021E0AF6F
MDTLFWLAAGSIAVFYWLDTAKAREIAISHGRRACADMHVQFLDGSVVRHKTCVSRNPEGQVSLMRYYHFEFTADGLERRQGHIQLCGNQLILLEIDYPFPEEQDTHSLILSVPHSENFDAIRPRAEKRSDCLH